MPGAYIWGWDGAAAWRKARVDLAGHLQVDVLTAGPTVGHCYGYLAPNWYELLVESAANANLRARLYGGANAVGVRSIGEINPVNTYYGLYTNSCLRISDGPGNVWSRWDNSLSNLDGSIGRHVPPVTLMAYNGATWDRLRSYGVGILKVGRAEVGLLTVRKVAVGQVGAAGARKLYWITMNPTAANSVIELTDDTDGSTAVVWDMTHGVNAAHHMNMDPPMEFSNGIWLKTLTNFTSVIFGYL